MAEQRSVEQMARQMFEMTKVSWMMAQRTRVEGIGDLSDQEFLTLDAIEQKGTMIVGDLQRYLGVLPAQMSRIIRAMETRQPPFIKCSINPDDRRKIDVALTDTGKKAVTAYRDAKLKRSIAALSGLAESDRNEFMRIVDLMRASLRRRDEAQLAAEEAE